MMLDQHWPIVLALVLLLVALIAPKVAELRARARQLEGLRDTWGQPLRRSRDDRPLGARTPPTALPGTERLDDGTWSDLDLEAVFGRIDRTLSAVGAQTLYKMLRCPPIDLELVRRREALVRAVAVDAEDRVRMQAVLVRLGDRRGWDTSFAIAGSLPRIPGPLWLLRLLPSTMIATLGAGVALEHSVFLFTGLFLAFALPMVHTLANRRIGHHLGAISDVRRILDAAVALQRVLPAHVRTHLDDVIDQSGSLRRRFGFRASIPRPGRFGQGPELVAEYTKAFGLTELVGYQRAMRALRTLRGDYDRLLDVVGEIDAALSIAYLREKDAGLKRAVIDDSAATLTCKGLRHPLIRDAVGNDVELGPRGLLLAGSNMAGKSTFLRALGVNLVLARAVGLVAAGQWRSRPLRVATSMRVHDDITAGKSTYRAEVDRVHALVERTGGDHLFLLDEIFRGTNPRERIAASAAVLRFLCKHDLVAAVTHDAELWSLLQDTFVVAHFTEDVREGDVVYDYRLREGAPKTINALAILRRTGFPTEILDEAERLSGCGEAD